MRPTNERATPRVLLVVDDMGVGGTQKQVAAVAGRLVDAGIETGIVCLERGGVNLEPLRARMEVHILGVKRIYDHKAASATASLSRIIRTGRWDVVEAYLPAAHFISAISCAAGAARCIVARRNSARLDPPWYAAAAPLVNRMSALSIANSQSVKKSVVKRYLIRPSKVAVIPNIIDPPASSCQRAEARKQLSIAPDAFTVAAVGTMRPVKDYPTVLRAFAGLACRGLKAVLVLAGDGSERGRILRLAHALGLNGELRILGTTSHVQEVLAAADLYVHASVSEGSSNALLEAMAARLPAVVSDIPANRECLEGLGEYFAPGDWRGCLDGFLKVAADPPAASRKARRLQQAVRRRFDVQKSIARRRRIYTALMEAAQ